jgi:hypothetical protein
MRADVFHRAHPKCLLRHVNMRATARIKTPNRPPMCSPLGHVRRLRRRYDSRPFTSHLDRGLKFAHSTSDCYARQATSQVSVSQLPQHTLRLHRARVDKAQIKGNPSGLLNWCLPFDAVDLHGTTDVGPHRHLASAHVVVHPPPSESGFKIQVTLNLSVSMQVQHAVVQCSRPRAWSKTIRR